MSIYFLPVQSVKTFSTTPAPRSNLPSHRVTVPYFSGDTSGNPLQRKFLGLSDGYRVKPSFLEQLGIGFPAQTESYSVTDRAYDDLVQPDSATQEGYYPIHFLSDLTPDMNVLDVGAGTGEFVEDLRRRGLNATGLDMSRHLPDKPYFVRKSLQKAQFPDGHFDRIFSSWSIFFYRESRDFRKAALLKLTSMLKPGGRIRLAPVTDAKELKAISREIGGLQVTDGGEIGNWPYLEFTRKKVLLSG